jgi:hypothetical protein
MLPLALALLTSAEAAAATPGGAIAEPWAKGCAISRHGLEATEKARRAHLRGISVNYEIIRPWTADYDIEPIVAKLGSEGYTVQYGAEWNAMGRLWYLYAVDNSTLSGKAEGLQRLQALCDTVEAFDFTVLRGKVMTRSERRKLDRAIRRNKLTIPRLPEAEDLDRFLSRSWERYATEFFGGKHAQFSRVRDSECRHIVLKVDEYYDCKVGVLATSQTGPEYEQANIRVEWGPEIFHRRDLKEHLEEIIVIN